MNYIKKNGYYIKDEGEYERIWVDPINYCIQNFNKCSDDTILCIFQDELHSVLNSYMSPFELANKIKLCYPLIDDVSPAIENHFKNLHILARKSCSDRDLEFNDSVYILSKYKDRHLSPDVCAKILSILYKDLEKNVKNLRRSGSKYIEIDKIEDKTYENKKFLRPVIFLKRYAQKELDDYFKTFILHGSLATLDYVENWSDVDTYAVIKKDVISDYKKLSTLRNIIFKMINYFLMIDPYQHHGIFVNTEIDTEFYPQAYLPFAVMNNSRSFLASSEIEFIERNEDIEKLNVFWNALQVMRKASVTRFPTKNYYVAKFFLAYLQTMPTYYLQAKNIHIYKKHSFDMIRKEFSTDILKPVDIASRYRNDMVQSQVLPECILHNIGFQNPFTNLFAHHLLKNKIKKDVLHELDYRLISGSLVLCEDMLRKLEV